MMFTYSTTLFASDIDKTSSMAPVIDPLSGTNIAQMVAGLVFVLLIVVLVAWLLRRVGGVTMSGGSGLNVIGGMSMGARERVVLMQVGEEQILIGVSPGRIQKLHVLETPIDVQTKSKSNMSFSNKLTEVLQGKLK